MAILNFLCKKCNHYFFGDVGKISFPPPFSSKERPDFEKDIICSECGNKLSFDKGEVELTELGQTQLTELELRYFEQHPPKISKKKLAKALRDAIKDLSDSP